MKYWREPLDRGRCEVPKGKVTIIDKRCKGCRFCVEFCPRKVLEVSKGFNEKGYHPPEIARPDDCIACGFCELVCPDFAIFVDQQASCPPPAAKAPKTQEVGAH